MSKDIKTNDLWLMQGDCLERMKEIESGSVDLILSDLPYGTMKGANLDGWSGTKTDWDVVIDTHIIMKEANRILRKNGKMCLFAQQPFTTELITKALPNLPYCYSMIWEKDHFANALTAKKAPLNYYEDILVFSKSHEGTNTHPLAGYVKKLQFDNNIFWNKEIAEYYYSQGFSKSINNAKAALKHFLNWDYVQFSAFTETHYNRLNYLFNFDKSYQELKKIDNEFKSKFSSTFNLWQGGKFKSNILKYKKDYDGYHPTQKPVLLLEDLIKTFSNKDNLVLDMTMGSGSTGVACKSLNRKFIGIELDHGYFEIAKKRIEDE